MGKIKQSDLDKLKEAGKLSASAEKALKKTKSVSKKQLLQEGLSRQRMEHMFHLVFTFVVVEDLNHQMR